MPLVEPLQSVVKSSACCVAQLGDSSVEFEEPEEDDGPDPTRLPQAEAPLSLADLDRLRQEADSALRQLTGLSLPAWPELPPKAHSTRRQLDWGIDIPVGPLFYPCCGSDTTDAGKLFSPFVNQFHFADPFHPPIRVRRTTAGSPRPASSRRDLVTHQLPCIGNVVLGAYGSVPFELEGVSAYSHRKDGLLTLLEDLGPLAVFFYRGDSSGEGGSGQDWLMPVLFDVVLSRMIDGGVIYTDGSNGGGFFQSEFPSGSHVTRLPMDAEVRHEMVYRNRLLRCVYKGDKKSWHYPEAGWQVTAMSPGSSSDAG